MNPVHQDEEAARRRSHLMDEVKDNNTTTRRTVEEAPKSRGLPLANHSKQQPQQPEINLLHPILNRVPLQFRFIFNGLLGNVLFMITYNKAVTHFHLIAPSTIYSVVYFCFIPIGHALVSLLVFGWPEKYFPSLISNFPIGLTAIAIGSVLTAYLDKIDLNTRIEDYIRDNFSFSKMPARADEEQGEFYSSLLVLVVTSVWTYLLSVYVNSPPQSKYDKKEL